MDELDWAIDLMDAALSDYEAGGAEGIPLVESFVDG